MAREIVGAIGGGPVVAKSAQTADVPAHLDIVFAADPAQLLADVCGPVPLAALVHFALVHAPRGVPAIQPAGHGEVGGESNDRGGIGPAGQRQPDLRAETLLQRVGPILYL